MPSPQASIVTFCMLNSGEPTTFLILAYSNISYVINGTLEVKLPTIWRDGKAEVGRVREEKKILKEVRRSEKRKSEKREDSGARKGRKVMIHCVFPLIWRVEKQPR